MEYLVILLDKSIAYQGRLTRISDFVNVFLKKFKPRLQMPKVFSRRNTVTLFEFCLITGPRLDKNMNAEYFYLTERFRYVERK